MNNRLERMAFEKEHIHKPLEFWRTVIFSDDSLFCIFVIKGRKLVWRIPCTVLRKEHLLKTVKQSASVIAQQLSTATGRQVSLFTVARRLHKGGLFARRPERCLQLKVDHRRHRLQWCREHKNWTTVNGVVSYLWMRVGLVPEAILNAF
ncbi:transposable element Tcb2 transposase [Trichonephila clavipes]|nr:transposable element Tcb2 transposase [Trichonephila clavipes]